MVQCCCSLCGSVYDSHFQMAVSSLVNYVHFRMSIPLHYDLIDYCIYRSSTPSLILNPVPPSSPPAALINSAMHSLPPMPPLTSYKSSDSSMKLLSSSAHSNSGLNLTVNSRNISPVKHVLGSPTRSAFNSLGHALSGPLSGSASSPSWLTALSGQPHGQKRPPPAHSNNQPTAKRPMLDKVASNSPSSSNSNMSPLVGMYLYFYRKINDTE